MLEPKCQKFRIIEIKRNLGSFIAIYTQCQMFEITDITTNPDIHSDFINYKCLLRVSTSEKVL